jgi:two-component system response regulator AtoC
MAMTSPSPRLRSIPSVFPAPFGRDLIYASEAMGGVAKSVCRIAPSEAKAILLQGETGVGKDIVARTLHLGSHRAHKRFVAVNCGAIPESLFESELFGHERGAFTDARSPRSGLLELSHHGTLFLDEIAQLSLPLQGKLLRVLEDGSFRRLGGQSDVEMDVRFVAATNVELWKAVQAGTFRIDLYYRLNVFQIKIPPLRERPDDIVPLVHHFIDGFNQNFRREIRGISKEAAGILLAHSWPGNVRELRNVVERAMVVEDSSTIGLASLPPEIDRTTVRTALLSEDLSLERMERHLVIRALDQTGGNQVSAARLLGISRDAVRYKVTKHGLQGMKRRMRRAT